MTSYKQGNNTMRDRTSKASEQNASVSRRDFLAMTSATAMKAYERPEPWIPRTGDIYEDWIDAIKSGKKSSNDFTVASHVTEIMLLGNIAVRMANSNKTLIYDGEKSEFTNHPEANQLLHYTYREGWTL
jgi:hypothetical protein